MSDAKGNSRSTGSERDREVLGNLPHTRPQRSSARRDAARAAAAVATAQRRAAGRSSARSRIGGGTAQGGPRNATARATAAKSRTMPKRSPGSTRRRDAAPRQGFESDGENMNGSVQPPGGAELVATAAEIVGELAKVGLSAGERLLKDAFSRLPRS